MRALPALLVLLLAAGPARADLASPSEPGTPAGEPTASLDGLRVVRESLTLDLRPVPGRRLAEVTAEYRVVNAGPARVVGLDLLALGGSVEPAQVWLDGQPVVALPRDRLPVPPAWAVAQTTPALDGGPAPYAVAPRSGAARGVSFVVTVPTGQHTVQVRYRLRVGSYDDGDHPNRVWQLAYGLAPARRWAGFGVLDLAVVLPEGWDAAASLPLRRDGDRLVGRFAGVPGDVLAVSARAPAPALRVPFRVAGGVVALVLVGFIGVVSGRLVAQARRPARAAWPGALLAGVLAAAALVALVSTGDDLGDSAAHGYRTVITMMTVWGPAALVAGALATQAVAVWAARHWRPAPAGRP